MSRVLRRRQQPGPQPPAALVAYDASEWPDAGAWHQARLAWHEQNAVAGRGGLESALGSFVDLHRDVHQVRMDACEPGSEPASPPPLRLVR